MRLIQGRYLIWDKEYILYQIKQEHLLTCDKGIVSYAEARKGFIEDFYNKHTVYIPLEKPSETTTD